MLVPISQVTPLSAPRCARVLELLAPILGERPRVVTAHPLGSEWAPVTRLRLDTLLPGGGTSVVVKTTRQGSGEWGVIEHLRRERVALELLAGSGVAPTLLAADDAFELIVMTDMQGPRLEELLLGTDRPAAAAAMAALGDALGRLHTATLGREDEHLDSMDRYGSPRPAGDRYGMWTGVEGWDHIEETADLLGFPSPRGAREDVAHVRAQLLDPGPFLALTHTDPGPPNVIAAGEGAALVDFEGSGFRHIGLDIAWLHFPFPNYSAHYAVLPPEVVRAADDAYRARLSVALPETLNDNDYGAMLAVGMAAALVVRTHRLDRLASEGQDSHGSWRRRTQLHQQIQVFVEFCRMTGQLTDLAHWFESLAVSMADRWPDAGEPPPPLFPAFSTGRIPSP